VKEIEKELKNLEKAIKRKKSGNGKIQLQTFKWNNQ
jgi:hypothetical protein